MINPSDFFKVAEDLANNHADEEAVFRTSISRAYYAAYHEVAAKYAEKNNIPRSDSIFDNHQNFIRKLREMRTELDFKKLGNQLNDLKSDRTTADYKLNREVSRNSAKKSCAASKRILLTCQKI